MKPHRHGDQVATIRRKIALMTACVLLAASSLARHDLKWPSPVSRKIVRISAMSSLVLPCATPSKASLSRSARCGFGASLSNWVCNSLFHRAVNSFPIYAAAGYQRIHSKRSSHFLVSFRHHLNPAVRYLQISPLYHYLFLLSDFRSNR